MKPRQILATATTPEGGTLELHLHDNQHYLHLHGQQLAHTGLTVPEQELARIATHPFRPARQPKILLLGLGLGSLLHHTATALPQKRATILTYEPLAELSHWQTQFFPQSNLLTDSRCKSTHTLTPSTLSKDSAHYHAILTHADYCPTEDNKTIIQHKRWINAIYESLQPGGVLGITAIRPIKGIFHLLRRQGFDISETFIEKNLPSGKIRRYPILLARKLGTASI